jgi:hypothetical protein
VEQSRLIFTVAQILARLVADDYRRAGEYGLDLKDLGTPKERRSRSGRLHDRATVVTDVGNLRDAYTTLEWYRDAFARRSSGHKTLNTNLNMGGSSASATESSCYAPV